MSATTGAANASPAQRFAAFNARPEIRRVTAQYADWSICGHGCIIKTQLSALAMFRQAGRITRQDYRASVRKLSAGSGLPHRDFQLIAECCREMVRLMLAEAGQIPFTPGRWDSEDGEA